MQIWQILHNNVTFQAVQRQTHLLVPKVHGQPAAHGGYPRAEPWQSCLHGSHSSNIWLCAPAEALHSL